MEQQEQNSLDLCNGFSSSNNFPQHDVLPQAANEVDSSFWWQRLRLLAENYSEYEYDAMRIDYSVLAVCVMTLGLILVVEVLRHKLDHLAVGRPYFLAVLENVYAELATLGIVEFFLFVLQTYYKNMNKSKKEVFGMVHFALFYTAILNAFQSVILAFFTMRVSRRLWVQTEALELTHYVEIREEFERISQQLLELKRKSARNSTSSSARRSSGSGWGGNEQQQPKSSHSNQPNNSLLEPGVEGGQQIQQLQQEEEEEEVNHDAATSVMNNSSSQNAKATTTTTTTCTTGASARVDPETGTATPKFDNSSSRSSTANNASLAELALEFNWNAIATAARNTLDRIQYPQLKYRYHELLIQVRFHELRVHFVEAYNLPTKFWVSEYLMRSELSVLIKLVNVSTYAWLLLTASANLLYYVLGIVGTYTQDPEIVGTALVYIFFGSMGIFIVVAMILYNKMKLVFKSIMHKRHLWQEAVKETETTTTAKTETMSSSTRRKSQRRNHGGGGDASLHGSLHASFRPKKSKVHGELAREQLGLFWMSSPKLVITVIQFMQFGYAVALSVVIIFQNELESSDIHIGWYWFTVLFCYSCFVAVAVQVIPRYTLCTSLGQLVDRQRLHEAVAVFRLNEARRQHLELLILEAYQKQKQLQQQEKQDKQQQEEHDESNDGDGFSDMLLLHSAPVSSLQVVAPDETSNDRAVAADLSTRPSKPEGLLVAADIPGSFELQRRISGSATAASTTNSDALTRGQSTAESSIGPPGAIASVDGGITSVPDLAEFNTSAVREPILTLEQQAAAQRAERRSRRKKSVSDGVALMSAVGRANAAPTPLFTTLQSTGSFLGGGEVLSSPSPGSALPNMAGDLAIATSPATIAGTNLPPRAAERAARRRNRKKSVSDGVAFMAKLSAQEAMGPTAAAAGPLTTMPMTPRMAPRAIKDTDARPNPLGDTARIARLVKMDTATLRAALPQGELDKLSERDERKKQRGIRRTAVSTGVDFMARLSDDHKNHTLLPQTKGDHIRRNSGSLSDVAAEMLSPEDTQAENLRARKGRRRQKSVSDGVALMASLGRIDFESEPTDLSAKVKTTDDITTQDAAFLIRPKVNVAAPAPAIQTQDNVAEIGILLDVVDEDHDEVGMDETENDSVRSVASGYCCSDIDDLPEVNMEELAVVEHRNDISFRDRCRWLFLDKRFVVSSNVFGTLVAFFFVAERVERFMHTENILPPGIFISFDFPETVTFWLLSTWLYLFLIVDCLIFYSLGCYCHLQTAHERDIWVSGVIDAVIVSVCLAVFYVAEAKRCCDPTTKRRALADFTNPDYGPAPCDCSAFGTRLFGGLGTIEPYTSLIALRLFRFWTATLIVRRLDDHHGKNRSKEDDQVEAEEREEQLDPFDVYKSDAVHGHGHVEEKGTAAELWEVTVGRHPDLVAKHGEFSREVLMAMLGIPIVEQEEVPGEPSGGDMDDSGDHPAPNPGESGITPRKMFHLHEQYPNLPVEAKEIILSGRLGVRVRSVANLQALDTRSPIASTDDMDSNRFFTTKINGTAFEVAPLDPSSGAGAVHQNVFDTPNATLVRSMRRADRKLPPMLSSWTAVDVVLTRFEIVYFDATNVDDEDILRDSGVDAARKALIATKGGKGLRLCDVAVGRRVVGRLPLSEVTAIAVEREMPCDTVREGDNLCDEVIQTEYWHYKHDAVHIARSNVWHKIKQDSLTVQTIHGHTLYLRFYSDLEDAEHHIERMAEENEGEGPLHKNNAFQWVQTIGRQCGPDQLKQLLPHFGDNSDNELRDYLVIKTEEERKGHRRGRSRVPLLVGRPMFPMRRQQSTDGGMVSGGSDHYGSGGRHNHRLLRSSSLGVEADGVGAAPRVPAPAPPALKRPTASRGLSPSKSGAMGVMGGAVVNSTSTPDEEECTMQMPPASKATTLTVNADATLQDHSHSRAAEKSAQNGTHTAIDSSPFNTETGAKLQGSPSSDVVMPSWSNLAVAKDQNPSTEDESGIEKVNANIHEISNARLDNATTLTRSNLCESVLGSPQAELEGEGRPSPTLHVGITEGWLATNPVATATHTDPIPTKAEEENFGQFVDP